MSDITVIGLGLMGSALARAFQNASHSLTVWNRTAAKMRPFIDDGIAAAGDVEAAISASPVVVVCIDNYQLASEIFNSHNIAPLLKERTVVQLSTGTPKQASDAEIWMSAHKVAYLDGALLCGPNDIGDETTQILLCGNEETYAQTASLLSCLGGNIRYLGANIRAASTLDLAWLCESYGQFLAVSHGARICESEGVAVDQYASVFPPHSDFRHYAELIHSAEFSNPTATLRIWRSALQPLLQQGKDADINTDFPDYMDNLLQRAEASGYGEENVMAIVKVLRTENT